EARIAELKERKRQTSDPAARDAIDNELSDVDGRGGVEQELRKATAEVLDELLPEAFATVREACRRLLRTKVMVTGQEMEWNMVQSLEHRVQRNHVYAIVDEVDSVLIDEARTPLIISGPVGNESDAEYAQHNAAVARLVKKQTDLVNSLVAAGEKAFEADDEDEAALNLYKAQLGGPKHKRLLKVLQETGA